MERRKIIISKTGELVHIDCHELPKGITIKGINSNVCSIARVSTE